MAEVEPSKYNGFTVHRGLLDNAPPALGDSIREGIRVRRNAVAVRVSRELALDVGLVEPTEAERADREARAAEWAARDAAERAKAGPRVELGRLLVALGWPAAFAEHLLHPWCMCGLGSDDPFLCSWARDLGFTVAYDEPGLLGWRVVAS